MARQPPLPDLPPPQPPPPALDPYFVPVLITLVILSIAGIAAAVVVTVAAPTSSSTVNTWLLAFLMPSIGVMVAYVSYRMTHTDNRVAAVDQRLDGRLTELLARLDADKADQRTMGHSEGVIQGRKDTEDRLSGSGMDLDRTRPDA